MLTFVTLGIFIVIFVFLTIDVFDAAVLALAGAVLMVILGVLTFEEAIQSIQFETLVLLMSMMLLVEISREAGIFSWLAVKIAKKCKGNPFILFLLLTLTTAVMSSFLDNVTTIVLMVPITIELVRGMGRDPKLYVIAEIIFSNLGGAATLIGDSSNIIIGGASQLSFSAFLINLGPPVLVSVVVISGLLIATHWKKHLKPISNDLSKLFVSQLLLEKIEYKFLKSDLNKTFMVKATAVIVLTIVAFWFQYTLGLGVGVIALTGAVVLLGLSAKEVELSHSLKSVDWSTLLFFSGLFIMVAALQKVGLLEMLTEFVLNISGENYLKLLLVIVWMTGFISMFLNTVPFVTLMVPVILSLQQHVPLDADPALLWWALSLGACLGGNASLVGASANVVGAGVARREGVRISFVEFMKYGLPLTLVTLSIASAYLAIRV